MNEIKRYLVAGINLFLCLIIAIGFVVPQAQTLKASKQDLVQKQADLQDRKDYFEKIKSLSQELDKRSGAMEKINSSLPLDDYSLPSVMDFLQKAASQSQVVIQKMEPGQSQLVLESPQVKKKTINLTVSGSYPSFKNFVSLVEKNARLIEAESLSFSFPTKEQPFVFDLDVSVHALFNSPAFSE